ncbi:hypothetical protein BS78_08G079700 [Paspalum vaginatum]|nr:hypothetical protein BS78_08G079700 [Paspalum vaginatum]KAJ1265488.1 hypothetical protein BS78_08G079700 [Paspalum vaginatum]
MEVQMAAAQGARRSAGRSAPPSPDHLAHHSGGANAKPVPGYLRPSPGSCHHVCKYGGAHAFREEKEPRRAQPPPRPRRAPSAAESQQSRVLLGKVRSVFRRRAGDSSGRADQKGPKAAAAAGTAKGGGNVEWKDIVVVAYGRVPVPRHGSSPEQQDKATGGSGDAKKKDPVKGRRKKAASDDKAKITGEQVNGAQAQNEPVEKSAGTVDAKSVKPPPKGKKPSALLVEKMAAVDQETLHGSYQTLSPSLVQSRADLLRELDKEMAHEAAATVEQERTTYALDQEDYAAAAESSRPVPAHRRAKSMMGVGGSRSVRFPFARQASKSSGASFKVRSRSTRAPEEERPAKAVARVRSRRGEDPSGGRGIQLRIRSLRRRGIGGGSGGTAGFVVPAVSLRHQKTLEKKKSQRLYNNLIEETAGKLVKARKSRVKALVGAFESVISKIAK